MDRFASIVRALVAAAPPIAAQVAEARRKAEEEHARWLVKHEAWLREERAREEKEAREERERKRRAARKTSHDDLLASIEHWAWTRQVEEFFADVDQRMKSDAPEDRAVLQERVALAGASSPRCSRPWRGSTSIPGYVILNIETIALTRFAGGRSSTA